MYESCSDISEDMSASTSDGELGPVDLVVVGQSLHGSSSGCSFTSSSDDQTQLAFSHVQSIDTGVNLEDKASTPEPPLAQFQASTWWCPADIAAVKGLKESAQVSTMLDARVIATKGKNGAMPPWKPGESSELYTSMGMVDPCKCYLAVWLNLGSSSLLFVLELLDDKWMKTCLEDNFLTKRLKFISNPVRMTGALPSKLPKDAEAVGTFFGKKSTSCARGTTDAGIPYVCIQVDVFAKWLVKLAFQQVALRPDNILECLLVDGECFSVLAGCRLTMTPELLQLLTETHIP